jgi:hypothetical protein
MLDFSKRNLYSDFLGVLWKISDEYLYRARAISPKFGVECARVETSGIPIYKKGMEMENEHNEDGINIEFLFDVPDQDAPEWIKEKVEITFQVAEFGYLLKLLHEHHAELVKRSEVEPDNAEIIMGGLTTEIVRNRLQRIWDTNYTTLSEETMATVFANEVEEWLTGNN